MPLRTRVKLIKVLQYKLQIMGISIEEYRHTCVKNLSVVENTSIPGPTLNKKSNSIAYHYVRSKFAENILRIIYETMIANLAYIATEIQGGSM